MPRGHNYVQTLIGDCGHVVIAWPQLAGLGGTNPRYICDECTAAKYGLPADNRENLSVWVAEAKDDSRDDGVKKRPPPKPRKARPAVCSICRNKGHTYTACPLLKGQTEIPVDDA